MKRWRDNLGLKIFSVLTAMMLFVFVSAESDTEVQVAFPIQVKLPEGSALVGQSHRAVEVTLRGPWASLRTFQGLGPIVIDLSGEEAKGRIRRNVRTAQVPRPPGMDAVALRPAEIEINLDRLITKEVRIEPLIRKPPPAGFGIRNLRVKPSQIALEGPESLLQELNFINTRDLDLSKVRESTRLQAGLRAPAKPIRMQAPIKHVDIAVEVGEEDIIRAMDIEVEAPSGYTAANSTINIRVKGRAAAVGALDPQAFRITLDSPKAKARLEPALPSEIALQGSLPKVKLEPTP